MYRGHKGFTLIEILISISLLSLVLLALYKSLDTLRASNRQLLDHLQKAQREKQATQTLFLDIAGSDGNISIAGDEFAQLCLEESVNSLYGLPSAKVCWVVSKEDNRLLRSEGNHYTLPLKSDDRVSVDKTMEHIELFRVYKNKTEVLVLLQQKNKKPISFVVYGVAKKVKKKIKKAKNKSHKRPPFGTPPIPPPHTTVGTAKSS